MPTTVHVSSAVHERFPTGISAELCWNRWHDAHDPLRNVTPKLFRASSILPPADIARELARRRKIKGVMEILQGDTTLRTVDLDPAYAWKQCWNRCVAVFGLEEKRARAWSVSTLYDHLIQMPEATKAARAAPSITFSQFQCGSI